MLHNKLSHTKRSLSDQIRDQIIEMLETEEFPTNKLPAESKLAKRFGVSINVVREALLLMREEGLITKKHGSGNYFHLSALSASNRIDQIPDFEDLLRASGFDAYQPPLKLDRILPPEHVRVVLRLQPGELALHYTSTIYADGDPAILCKSWFPDKYFRIDPVGAPLDVDFFDLLLHYFDRELAYGQMEFLAESATERERDQLGLELGSPYIVMEESFYSLEDTPLVFSRNKFNKKYMSARVFCV